MKGIRYIKGDATYPNGEGKKIIAHICNDLVPGKWGRGFVLAISKRWTKPRNEYIKWSKGLTRGTDYKLGSVQFVKVEEDIVIANMLAQHGIGMENNVPPIRYGALKKCLETLSVAALRNNATIHSPKFGSGLSGGSWEIIENYIKEYICDKNVEIFIYTI